MPDKVSSEGLMYAYVLTGDTQVFNTLYVRHSRSILAWYTTRVGPTCAQDILQDVWAKVTCNAHSYDVSKGEFRVWINYIARNELYDYLRTCKRRPTEALCDSHVPTCEMESAMGARMDVETTLAHITPEQRELLTRAYIWGQRGEEVAACMGKSESAARTQLMRARNAFREAV